MEKTKVIRQKDRVVNKKDARDEMLRYLLNLDCKVRYERDRAVREQMLNELTNLWGAYNDKMANKEKQAG